MTREAPTLTVTADERYITSKTLADLLDVSERTVKDWRADRTGPPFVRLGRAVRYRKSDVDAWLRSHSVETAA